jgi:MSHA biogenesis protein MshL
MLTVIFRALLIFIPAILLSCSQLPTLTEDTLNETFGQKIDDSANTTPLPPPQAVNDALIPDFNPSLIHNAEPKAMLFNISVHDVNAREFFMGLVMDSPENMVVHPDVTGTISLELKNVSIAQVMDAVQKVYGYDYKKNDMGYIVYPSTLQTRIFKINRLDLIRKGQSNTLVSSGQITGNSSNNRTNNNSSSSNNSSTGNNSQNNGFSTSQNRSSLFSGSWINTNTETDFWKELETTLQAIISVDSEANITINRQTGMIIARAKPMQLREIEQFLTLSQQQINRQVIIEAKIVEVILDDSHQAGVNWQSVVRQSGNAIPFITGIGAVGEVFTIGATWGDFSALVELLETQGKTNILSSPRISTLNNQKAIIKVGADEYFITDVSSNTVSSGSATITNPELTWTPFFSGIALDVTPQINDQDEITLHIHPSITRVEDQTKEFTINGEIGSLPMALSTVRESDSIIRAQNNQIVIIGGLMQEYKEESKDGIFGLTQIPYVGNLFRVNKGQTRKSELIIMLKPTLIKGNHDWMPSLDASRQTIDQLQQHPLWQ